MTTPGNDIHWRRRGAGAEMVNKGDSVLLISTKHYGVVIGHSKTTYGLLRVRVWDSKHNVYKEMDRPPSSLLPVQNKLVLAMINYQDDASADAYFEQAISLAIVTHDWAWLEQIGERMTERQERG